MSIYVRCPVCFASDDSLDDTDASVELGSVFSVVAFSCPRGHTWKDLTPGQELEVEDDAIHYRAQEIRDLESAADDARYHEAKDEGRIR